MDNSAKRFDQTCPECGGSDFVDDQAAGDLICRVMCGDLIVWLEE